MNPTRTTPQSRAGAVTTSRSRRPAHPAPVPAPGRGAAASAGREESGSSAADPVDRLEGIRVRLAALAPLLRDEPARRLDEVLREVEALVEQLGPRPGESQVAASPSPVAAAPVRAVPAPAPAPTPTTGHRPPALPCGPDYPLPPAHRAS